MTRNAAIYVRVSTEGQQVKGQLESLKTYCSQQNFNVYKIYSDKISGSKSSRPALNELMIDAKRKQFDVVIVWKLDRLGRSLPHLIKLVGYFREWGIDFICTTQNIDTTSSNGRLIFHIMAAMAEFEKELISERTKEGLKHAKNVGKRGKDKKPRRKAGYNLRYQKKGGVDFNEFM